MECGKISELVDARLEGEYDKEQLHKIVLTASCCVRHSSSWRPSMTEVHFLNLLSFTIPHIHFKYLIYLISLIILNKNSKI